MKPIDLVELVNKNANSVKLETYFEPDKGFYIYTGVFELQIGSNFVSTYFWTNVYPSVEEQFLSTTTHSSLPTSPGRYFGFGSVMKKSDINSFLSYLKKQFLQRPELSRYIIFETTGEFAGSFEVETEEMDVKTMYEVVKIIAAAANPIVNSVINKVENEYRKFINTFNVNNYDVFVVCAVNLGPDKIILSRGNTRIVLTNYVEDVTEIPLGTLEYYEGKSLKWYIDTSEIVDLSPLNGVCTTAQRKLMKEHYILSKMGSFVVSLKTSTVGGFRNEKFIEYTKVSLQSNFSIVLQNILNTFPKIGG